MTQLVKTYSIPSVCLLVNKGQFFNAIQFFTVALGWQKEHEDPITYDWGRLITLIPCSGNMTIQILELKESAKFNHLVSQQCLQIYTDNHRETGQILHDWVKKFNIDQSILNVVDEDKTLLYLPSVFCFHLEFIDAPNVEIQKPYAN